jgi:hypothetical protein
MVTPRASPLDRSMLSVCSVTNLKSSAVSRPERLSNTCPHCGSAPCLSRWRKLLLGPGGSAPCRVCGKGVSVDGTGFKVVLLPPSLFIISLGTGWWGTNLLAAVGILAVMLLVCALIYMYPVPLTDRPQLDDDGNPRFR